MSCPVCGQQNPEGAQFCSNCGTALVAGCSNCGAALPESARFCPSCGQAVDQAVEAGQERKLVTVVFADVTGSTVLGERFDPEDLAHLMSTYFEAMRSEIEAEGGTVEKFIGDAVMSVFGVPSNHEDDPARALRASLRMMDRLVDLNKELTQSHDVSLEMRVGVNTGEVLAYIDAGPGQPLVAGDTVNVAARLQAAAQPGQILVAERTARAVRRFTFDDLGELQLRGKAIPVNAFELVGREEGASERGVPDLKAPMVGRDNELDLLMTIYQRTKSEDQPNLVTLFGDAGVGKSRLTKEFLDLIRAQDEAVITLRGRCLPYGEGIAYWPLAEILKDVAGIRDSDLVSEALQRLRVLGDELLTEELTADAGRTVASLAHTMGLIDPNHSFSGLDPREIKARSIAAWRSLLTSLGQRGPVVVIVEDIHWADPALLDILEELNERLRSPVMIVCPARPELTDDRPGWGGGRRNHTSIFLVPLSPEDSDTLVGSLLAIADLPEPVRQTMMEKAEGNPFFLEEIIRHLIDQGLIVRDGDRWKATTDLVKVVVPDTVQGVLAARIDLLDTDEKRVLQRAAVVGRVFWPSPIVHLLGTSSGEIGPLLDQLEERDLIQSRLGSSMAGEPEYIFKHILTREVAYDSLPRRERGDAHAAVATWIESATREGGSELVELISHHWGEAYRIGCEDPATDPSRIEMLRSRSFESTLRAAEASRGRAAIVRASRMAKEALALSQGPLERARALVTRGLTALAEYSGDLAWDSLSEATDLFAKHAPDDHRLIARTAARAVETPTRWPGSMTRVIPREQVDAYIEMGMAHLDDDDLSEEMLRLLLARSMKVFARSGADVEDAQLVSEATLDANRAVAIAQAIDRVDLTSASLDALGSVAQAQGMYRDNQQVIERRLRLVPSMANPWEIGDVYAMAAWNLGYMGDYVQAAALAGKGFEHVDEETVGIAVHNMSWSSYADFWLGNWDRIVDEMSGRVRRLMGDRAHNPPYFSGHQFGSEAFIHTTRRDAEGTELHKLLHDVSDQAESTGDAGAGHMFRAWDAWVTAREGDVDEAFTRLDKTSRQRLPRPFLDAVRASILLDAGMLDDVEDFIVDSLEYARWSGVMALPPHLERLRAAARLRAGDPSRALSGLAGSREAFDSLGMRWEVARTDLWMAEALLEMGNQLEARSALETALPILETLGSLIEIDRSRTLLDRL